MPKCRRIVVALLDPLFQRDNYVGVWGHHHPQRRWTTLHNIPDDSAGGGGGGPSTKCNAELLFQSDPGSVLARMFDSTNSLPPAKIVDGAYFLDANPEVFAVILDYLRYRTLVVPDKIPQQCVVVLARYFGLHSLLVQLGDRVNNQVGWSWKTSR